MHTHIFPHTVVATALAALFGLFVVANSAHAEGPEPMRISAPAAKSMPIDISNETGTTSPYCPLLSRGLSRGMRDGASTATGEIKGLQKFLAHHFGTPEAEIATGYFGPITEAHVIRFQKEQNLPQVGIAGPLTRAAIAKLCGNTGDPTKPHVSLTLPKGGESYTFGDAIPVSWTTMNVASNTGMYLKLTTTDGQIVKSVTVPYAQGSTTLLTDGSCNGDFSDAIFGDCENLKYELEKGKRPFKIEAGLYTPEGACFGFCAPSTTPTVIVAKGESPAFHMEDPDAGAFTATSTSGNAPLTTTFTIARAGDFTLNFGDEKSETFSIPSIVCVTTPCNPTKEIAHTYKTPNQYYAILTRTVQNDCKPTKDIVCAAWVSREETVGTITIDALDSKKK